MVLGGDKGAILRDVVAEGGRMVAAGVGLGAVGALILARFLASALSEVGPFDLPSFASSALVLAAATLGAAFLPAVRATRIDPVEALRHE
jgi:ABC-type antimicrobial peptide transport system permease subunit